MYKRTAQSSRRKLLKDHKYMPSLNTLSTKGLGGMWSNDKNNGVIEKKPVIIESSLTDFDKMMIEKYRKRR